MVIIMDAVLKFGNNRPVLIDGKCVMYKVNFDKFTNRMNIARQMLKQYPKRFSNVGEVLSMLKAYEKTGDFVIMEHCAYILHDAN